MASVRSVLIACAYLSVGVLGDSHTVADGPPATPPWKSPAPRFPSSWFGANMKSFEFENPAELTQLRQYAQVLASWPEKVLTTNFSNATQVAIDDATNMKMLFGDNVSVFTYQSLWVGAAFYPEVLELMEDPAQYGDFFIQPTTVLNYTGYCSQAGVSPLDMPTCLGYYWNWCNETAVDFYVNQVLRAMVAHPNGTPYAFDGVFLDNSDGFSTRGATNPSVVGCDVANATMNAHIKTGKMFQQFGKWPVFSMTSTGINSITETSKVWAGGVGFTKFYEYFAPTLSSIEQLYNDTARGLPTMVHAPTAVKRHPAINLEDAVASYLVAAGGASHSSFQYSAANWVVDNSWRWSSLYDMTIGDPLGPPIVTNYGVNKTGVIWTRKFSSGLVATVNCTPPVLRIPWCHGNVTGGDTIKM